MLQWSGSCKWVRNEFLLKFGQRLLNVRLAWTRIPDIKNCGKGRSIHLPYFVEEQYGRWGIGHDDVDKRKLKKWVFVWGKMKPKSQDWWYGGRNKLLLIVSEFWCVGVFSAKREVREEIGRIEGSRFSPVNCYLNFWCKLVDPRMAWRAFNSTLNDIDEPVVEIPSTLHAVCARNAWLDDIQIGGVLQPFNINPKLWNVVHVGHGGRVSFRQSHNTRTSQLSTSGIKIGRQSRTRADAFLEGKNSTVDGFNSKIV